MSRYRIDSNKLSLSAKQKYSARMAKRRINLWHGAVRSGKTEGTIVRYIHYVAGAPPGDLLLAGKTIDALKRNVINPLLEYVGNEGQYYPGRRELRLWDRVIYTVGASDERSEGKIRGSTLAGAYGDEITLWPESFFKMMLSRMSVKGAKFFGTTNTDNPNHWLKKGYLDRESVLNMISFHFKLDDNPYLDPEYVANLKQEYTGLWYKRFILGLWCVAEGAIYDFFDEKKHVLKKLPVSDYYDVGIDYGTTNPTAFLLFGNAPGSKPEIWAEREYYYDPVERKRQQTDAEFVEDFKKFIQPVKSKIRNIYCDPSAESFQLALKREGGLPPIKDADNDVLNGIRTKATMLTTGRYAIYQSCKHYIDEFFSYMWDKKAQDRGEDKPEKTNDHLQDGGRYVIYTKFGTKQYDISKFVN